MMTTLSILNRARKLLARRGGWIIGASRGFRQRNGELALLGNRRANCYCLTGAIAAAAGTRMRDGDGYEMACRALGSFLTKRRLASPDIALIEWNDAAGRTKEQVVALIDKAIAGLEVQS